MKTTFIVLLVLLFAVDLYAQEFKTAPNGSRYYEKNGRYVFPGRLVLFNSDSSKFPSNQYQNSFPVSSNANSILTPSQSAALSANSTIVLNITSSQPTCGYGSGSIIVEAANGKEPYTYFLTSQYNFTTEQLTGNFPVQGAGKYMVKIKDANGDSAVSYVTLTNIYPGPVLVGFTSYSKASNCNTNDATITLNAWGGTPPYTYSLDLINFQTSNVFSNLYSGDYTFYVKDANGCIGSSSAPGVLAATQWNCYDNGMSGAYGGYACGNNGTVRISMFGPNAPYQYSMDGINFNTTGVFNNIGPGIHMFYIKKANGQVVYRAFNTAEFCAVSIDYISVAASCMASNGSLEVSAQNGTAPYSYTIDGINYQASNVFTNLAPGNYYITVKDFNGVKSSLPATVFDKCPIVKTVTTDETCNGNDGTITAGGFRGTMPYQYSIDGVHFQTSETFTGLKAGDYTITIRDDLGFTSTTTATVIFNCMQVDVLATDATCEKNNGSIKATAKNGEAPYQYSIDGLHFVTNEEFTNLAPGNYEITAKGNDGKTATKSVVINATSSPLIQIDTTGTSCKDHDGRVSVFVIGGKAPFEYSFDAVNYAQITSLINVAADSVITASVRDKNGCISSKNFKISKHCPLIVLQVRPEVCNLKDGKITVTGLSGFVPYTYSMDGVNYQTSNFFDNLTSGNYLIYVKDVFQVVNSFPVVVKASCIEASLIAKDETCGYSNGEITIQADKGTPPYIYSIGNNLFQTSNVFKNLKKGIYQIVVKDSLLSEFTTAIELKDIPGATLSVSSKEVSCANNDGEVELIASNGKTPYLFSLDSNHFSTTNKFINLIKGAYKGYVKDGNGCITSQAINVTLKSDLILSVPSKAEMCEGTNVQLSVISNGDSYNWSPPAALNNSTIKNPVAMPAATTKYAITVVKGICNLSDSVLVVVNPAPIALAAGDTTLCYGQNANLRGGGGDSYSWTPATYLDNPSNQNPIVKTPAGTVSYHLKVEDQLGCYSINNASVTIAVKPPSKLFAGNDTSIAKGESLSLSARDINNTGFNIFLWQPSTGLSNNRVQNPVAVLNNDITYIVTGETAEGCKASDTIKVNVFEKAEIFVPSGFTPNNDGLNDVLKAIPVGIKEFRFFRVFNRWGEMVFESKRSETGWNGDYKNIMQSPGMFTWQVSGVDFKGNQIKRTGVVILIR